MKGSEFRAHKTLSGKKVSQGRCSARQNYKTHVGKTLGDTGSSSEEKSSKN